MTRHDIGYEFHEWAPAWLDVITTSAVCQTILDKVAAEKTELFIEGSARSFVGYLTLVIMLWLSKQCNAVLDSGPSKDPVILFPMLESLLRT